MNDACGSVTFGPLAVGGTLTFTGDNTGATIPGDYVPGSLLDGNGQASVWHGFTTTTCATVTLNYCGTTPPFGNIWVVLATSCPADDNLIITNNFNDTDCIDGNYTLVFPDLPAGNYYVPVLLDPGQGAEGPYTVQVSASTCSGPVANDDCSSATPLSVSANCVPTAGSTAGAGQSLPPITCNGFTSSVANDVWYSFVANATNLTIDVTGNGDFDAVVEFFSGACPTPTSLACADATVGGELETIAATGLIIGNTYYVRVYPWEGGFVDLDFTICVYGAGGPPPANDQCGNVTFGPLAVGGSLTFSGNNTGATIPGDYAPGTLLDGNGLASVWHGFTTTDCADITLSYCGTTPPFGNVWIVLATSCPADDNLILSNNFNDTDCINGNYTVIFPNVPAGTYYVPVLNDPGMNAVGPYTIVASATACSGPLPNDDCASATPLTVGTSCVPIAGSTAGAGQSLPPITCNGFTSSVANDVWYSFVANATDLTIEVTGNGDFDAVVEFFGGSCPTPTSLDCADATVDGETETILATGLTIGNTYYVRVYPWAGGFVDQDFTICVFGGGGGAPANDLCGSVTAQSLVVGGSLAFTGDNTGATITGDYTPGSTLEGLNIPSVWHAFTTTECADVAVSYCGTNPAFENVWIVLATSCPADDNLVFNTSFNDLDCGDGNITVYYTALPAGTYYLPVLTDALANAEGPYTIDVTATACGGAPANDECADAIALPINLPADCPGNQVLGNNAASVANQDAPDCDATTVSFQDVWYSFNSLGNTMVDIGLDAITATDLFIEVLDACGGTSIFCEIAAPPYSVAVTPNTDYIVRVFSNNEFGVGGEFGICISAAISSGIFTGVVTGPSVFPNPSNGAFTFSGGDLSGRSTLEVIDASGRTVLSEQVSLSAGATHAFDLGGDAASGIYRLRIITENGIQVLPFVVK